MQEGDEPVIGDADGAAFVGLAGEVAKKALARSRPFESGRGHPKKT